MSLNVSSLSLENLNDTQDFKESVPKYSLKNFIPRALKESRKFMEDLNQSTSKTLSILLTSNRVMSESTKLE